MLRLSGSHFADHLAVYAGIIQLLLGAGNEGPQRFHNYGEGPYLGLPPGGKPLLESILNRHLNMVSRLE